MDEHRNALRIRSFLRGEIIHSNGNSKTECTIRDISETGARLQVPASVTLPECFDLVIPQKGMSERARIVWNHGGEIGVLFENRFAATHSAATASAPGGDTNRRIAELEAEVTKLRQHMASVRAMVEQIFKDRA